MKAISCMRLVRTIEILVGAVFVLAAAFKALDLYEFSVQIRYYGVLADPSLVRYAAMGAVILETCLGIALLIGLRAKGAAYAAVVAMLVVFSGLVIYAWVYRGLEDCGCFGNVLPMGPFSTLVKNAILAAAIGVAWWRGWQRRFQESAEASTAAELARSAAALASLGAVAACVLIADNAAFFNPPLLDAERPFAQVAGSAGSGSFDLSEGKYFVAMLSATCDDCMAAVEPLNKVVASGDAPPVVGLILGEPQAIEDFKLFTHPDFPLQQVPGLFWFDHVASQGPPRFYIVEDGRPIRYLDDLEPTTEKLLDLVAGKEPQ